MKPPRYTFVVKGRHWYFRRGDCREPLKGQPGEPEFESSYQAAQSLYIRRTERRSKRAGAARQRRLQQAHSTAGIVYLIGSSSGPVKIGFTTDLDRRLERLQMNSPRKLRVLAARDGTRGDELRLHREHRDARLHGEWFKRSEAVLRCLDVAATSGGTEEAQSVKLLTVAGS